LAVATESGKKELLAKHSDILYNKKIKGFGGSGNNY